MNDLLQAAKAVIAFRGQNLGMPDGDFPYLRLKAAVERAESQEPVQLSDTEICQIAKASRAVEGKAMLPVTFARAIEKAIWEKNQ